MATLIETSQEGVDIITALSDQVEALSQEKVAVSQELEALKQQQSTHDAADAEAEARLRAAIERAKRVIAATKT